MFPVFFEGIHDVFVDFATAEELASRKFFHVFGTIAKPPDKTLVNDRDDRRRYEPFGDAQLYEADDGAERIFGMEGRKHQMARKGSFGRHLGGFLVADFADENDVGILAENRSDGYRIGKPLPLVNARLIDMFSGTVFDRVFHRHDVHLLRSDLLQGPMESGRLSRTGRPGNENDPVLLFERVYDLALDPGRKVGIEEALAAHVLQEDAQYRALAMDVGHRAYAHVDYVTAQGAGKRSVLGNPVFRNVEVRRSLYDVDNLLMVLGRIRIDALEPSVDPHSDDHFGFRRFEMDVGSPAESRDMEELIEVAAEFGRLRRFHSGDRQRASRIQLVNSVADGGISANVGVNDAIGGLFYFFDGRSVERIEHDDRQMSFESRTFVFLVFFRVKRFDKEHRQRAHGYPKIPVDAGKLFPKFRIDDGEIVFRHVQILDSELPADSGKKDVLFHGLHFQKDFPEGLARRPLPFERGGKLVLRDEFPVDEAFSKADLLAGILHYAAERLLGDPFAANEYFSEFFARQGLFVERGRQLLLREQSLLKEDLPDQTPFRGFGRFRIP